MMSRAMVLGSLALACAPAAAVTVYVPPTPRTWEAKQNFYGSLGSSSSFGYVQRSRSHLGEQPFNFMGTPCFWPDGPGTVSCSGGGGSTLYRNTDAELQTRGSLTFPGYSDGGLVLQPGWDSNIYARFYALRGAVDDLFEGSMNLALADSVAASSSFRILDVAADGSATLLAGGTLTRAAPTFSYDWTRRMVFGFEGDVGTLGIMLFIDGGPAATSGAVALDWRVNYVEEGYTYELPDEPGGPAVPEPATWAMMIAGFGLVGGAARRRRARPTA